MLTYSLPSIDVKLGLSFDHWFLSILFTVSSIGILALVLFPILLTHSENISTELIRLEVDIAWFFIFKIHLVTLISSSSRG